MVYKPVRVLEGHDPNRWVSRGIMPKRLTYPRQTVADGRPTQRKIALPREPPARRSVSCRWVGGIFLRRRAGADRAQGPGRGGAAGPARLLGPEAAPRASGPVAHHGDPLPDRDRLPAIQFYRGGRQPG